MSFLIGKKQILLAVLLLALGGAVFLNWRFASSGANLVDTSQSQDIQNFGDAEFVDAQGTQTSAEYFTAARLNRQQTRDEAVTTLSKMLADSTLDDTQKVDLTTQAAVLAQDIEKEATIENIIKAKGFADCMVYLTDGNAKVVVSTSGLLDSDAAIIRDAVLNEASIDPENITIIPVNG